MTDKQIIIDGEQCQYLSHTGLCRLIYNLTEKSYDCSMCNENPNCYYKQLKHKEQECEAYKMEAEEGKEINAELKAENDLAKQLINWILKFFELTDYDWQDDQNEISALIEDYIDDKNSTIDFVNDINKGLFKKLTEIKELCKRQDLNQGSRCIHILQKISECEGNDETN